MTSKMLGFSVIAFSNEAICDSPSLSEQSRGCGAARDDSCSIRKGVAPPQALSWTDRPERVRRPIDRNISWEWRYDSRTERQFRDRLPRSKPCESLQL